MNDDDPILAKLETIVALLRATPTVKWATVTQASPLRVHLDGDIDAAGNPVSVAAQTVKTSIAVGTRVFCVEQDSRITVIES